MAITHSRARTGLLARRAKIVEHAWVRVAREALGADGQVIPQLWLAHTTAPNVGAEDRRGLDLVVYGATPHGGALCCDATLVSPLTRTGHPQPCIVTIDGAALRVAERRKHAAYPELARAGPQKLVVILGSELGGRWNEGARSFVRQVVRVRAQLRAANKGTPSCPDCTPWPRTVLCKLSNHSSGMARLFLPSWTTSTSLLHLSGSSSCMSTSRSPCGSMRASASTAPKPRPGMPLARNRRASGTSSPRAVIRYGLGIGRCPRISRVSSRWARRSEPMPLCSASSASNVLPKTGSWSASRMLTTSKLPGCFCATVLRRGQTTCCEYCPSRAARNTPLLTTQLSLGAWPSFSSMRTPRCRKRPREQPSSRRGLGDLACVARGPIVMRHIGPPGATRSLLFVTERLRSRSHCTPLKPSRLRHCEPRSMQQFTYVRKALKSRPGKPPLAWLGPHPRHRAAMSPSTICVDGSGMRPLPAMSARSRRTFLTCHPRPERCCCRRLARIPHVPSMCCLRMRRSSSLARSSGHSCCVGCACLSRQIDPWGDHRAACATAGVLPARAIPLERALARVAQHVRLADMNLDASVQDARRIEVVCKARGSFWSPQKRSFWSPQPEHLGLWPGQPKRAARAGRPRQVADSPDMCNGLLLWHGAQLAVDATLWQDRGAAGRRGCPAGLSPRPGRPAQAPPHLPKTRKGTPMPPRRLRCRGRWPLVARGGAIRPNTCARTRSSGTFGPACYSPRRLGAALEWHCFRCSAASLCNIVARAAAARGMPGRQP